MISLNEILKYRNKNVVEGFMKQYAVSVNEAEDVFQQLLKWLWLSQLCSEPEVSKKYGLKSLIVDDSLVVIDEMWHVFILFTKDYSQFCKKYFGRYIHHSPTTSNQSNNMKEVMSHMNKDEKIDFMVERKREQYNLVFDMLGENIFKKWYIHYHKKYSPKTLKELKN